MRMCRLMLSVAIAWLAAGPVFAEEIRMIGNSVMYSNKSILSNVIDSRDHKTLIKALKSVRLEQPLMRKGEFTVFAPDDNAFAALPKAYSDNLFRRSNKDEMARFLACHIVAGNALAGLKLAERLVEGGTLSLMTIGGCELIVSRQAGKFYVRGPRGDRAEITAMDVAQRNGIVQIINRALLPSS